MIIAMSGASGFVGTALSVYLESRGHRVVPIVRTGRSIKGDVVYWDPKTGWVDTERLRYCEGVIHLAGENIACKWTESEKREIYESRVYTAGLLCRSLSELDSSPKFFICASGTGCYGDRGDEVVDETAPYGEGFLAELCEAWEFASIKLVGRMRVVNLRFGMVLGKDGGALKRMLPTFRAGLGGKFDFELRREREDLCLGGVLRRCRGPSGWRGRCACGCRRCRRGGVWAGWRQCGESGLVPAELFPQSADAGLEVLHHQLLGLDVVPGLRQRGIRLGERRRVLPHQPHRSVRGLGAFLQLAEEAVKECRCGTRDLVGLPQPFQRAQLPGREHARRRAPQRDGRG